jgi:Cytochrome domain of cellobiose dehydrogenase
LYYGKTTPTSSYPLDTHRTPTPSPPPGVVRMLTWCNSGQFEPAPYAGPTVQVLSSNHTTDLFTAQLSISNATTWMNSGTLDVNSDNAGVIWSLSTVDVYQPSNPDTDFQQHQTMGTFDINMKAAQQTASPTSPTASATAGGPVITGDFAEPASLGLSHRAKVHQPLLPARPWEDELC